MLRLSMSFCAALNVLSISRVDFPWGMSSTKVRGVNLGGWLVLEP